MKDEISNMIGTETNFTSTVLNMSTSEIIILRNHFQRMALKNEIALDAQRAYYCMVFLILVMLFAVWYSGLCKTRKQSIMDRIDFEEAQPLTSMKDVVLRKSKYLPMFAQFYKQKKMVDRGTNP